MEGTFNAFHEQFRQGGSIYKQFSPSAVTPEVLQEFGIDADNILDVPRTGSSDGNIAATTGLATKIVNGEFYWFKGTNVIAVFTGIGNPPTKLLPTDAQDTKGTANAGYLLAQNPEAIVLLEDRGADFVADGPPASWEHPATDIVAFPFNSPNPPVKHAGQYDVSVDKGKLFFASTSDRGSSTVLEYVAGPWWSISVGGYAEKPNVTTTVAGAAPAYVNGLPIDFVANAHELYPRCGYCETGELSASSDNDYSAVSAAGAASRALLISRRAAGHVGGIAQSSSGRPMLIKTPTVAISPWTFRRALEQSAAVQTYGADPTSPGSGNLTGSNASPWATQGWGLLTTAFDDGLADRVNVALGLAPGTVPMRATGFCTHQTRFMSDRHAYWDNPSTGVDSGVDPIVYCQGP